MSEKTLSEQLADRHAENERVVEEAQSGTPEEVAAAAERKRAAAAKRKAEAKRAAATKEKTAAGGGRPLTAGTNKVATDMIDRKIAAARASNNAEMVKVLQERRKQVLANK